MKFDTTVKELQKEKVNLEAKLKQVSAALAALTKLGGKQVAMVCSIVDAFLICSLFSGSNPGR